MSRSRLIAIPTIVGLAAVFVALGGNAVAACSPPATVEAPLLQISSLDLAVGTRKAILSATNTVPGDETTAAVTVVNSSDRAMTYTMTRGDVTAGGAALSAALVLTIRTIGTSCADRDGSVLFDGPLDEAAIGSAEDARPLAAATAEILCFRATLPLDADDGYQGLATSVALTFSASRPEASQ
jgi:hypothetical protein